MERSRNLVIIPAFNEEKTISDVVKKCKPFADVLVVNDNSGDDTSTLAKAAGALVLDKVLNEGYTKALESGFKKAKDLGYTYVVTIDADGQHEASLVKTYFDLLKNESLDLVLGIRPYPARISEFFFCSYIKIRFSAKDILCGMKGYKISLYEKIGFFDSIESIGTELAVRYLKAGAKWKQLPVPIYDRADSPRFGSRLKANLKIFASLARMIILDFKT